MKLDKNINIDRLAGSELNFKGLKAAIIGGTGGIGRALSRFLADHGASVLAVGQTFRDQDRPQISFIKADLSLMSEARRVANELPAETLDLVIFTTGIFAAPTRQETPEGIERDMAVSFLSRLVILREIAPRLGAQRSTGAKKPRIFVMGYPGTGHTGTLGDLNAERSYGAMAVHMNTVAGNEMLVLEGAKRYPNIAFFGLNPGLIKTNIRDNLFGQGSWKSRLVEGLIGLLTPTAETYAARIAPLFVSPELEAHSAVLFDKKGNAILPSPGLTPDYVKTFMADSEALAMRPITGQSPVGTSLSPKL